MGELSGGGVRASAESGNTDASTLLSRQANHIYSICKYTNLE